VATGNTGMTGLLLATITNELDKIVIDGNHFDPSTDQNMLKLQIPGIMRIGGLKTILALVSNQHLLLFNATPNMIYPELNKVTGLENNKSHFSVLTEKIALNKLTGFLQP
jgi:hypothetical protein